MTLTTEEQTNVDFLSVISSSSSSSTFSVNRFDRRIVSLNSTDVQQKSTVAQWWMNVSAEFPMWVQLDDDWQSDAVESSHWPINLLEK